MVNLNDLCRFNYIERGVGSFYCDEDRLHGLPFCERHFELCPSSLNMYFNKIKDNFLDTETGEYYNNVQIARNYIQKFQSFYSDGSDAPLEFFESRNRWAQA